MSSEKGNINHHLPISILAKDYDTFLRGKHYEDHHSESSYFSKRHLNEEQRLKRTSTNFYTIINLFKGYIGISFLAVPHGFVLVGLYGAILGLFFILLLNYYSVVLLIKTRNKYKDIEINSISDLSQVLFGNIGRQMSDVLLIITQMCFCITYTIYFGEQLNQIFCSNSQCDHQSLFRVILSLLILPAIWQKQLRNVAYFSLLANIATVMSLILIVYTEFHLINNLMTPRSLILFDFSNFPIYFGQTMCLFEGNGMLLNFYSEVDQPKRFLNQIAIVMASLTGLGIFIGILSYMCYGSQIHSLIIYNLPDNQIGISVKMLYLITIIGIYILVMQPVFTIIENKNSYKNLNFISENFKYYLTRSLVIGMILATSYIIPSVTIMISLVGNVTGTLISIIFPVIVYNYAYRDAPKKDLKRKFNILYLIIGGTFGTIGFIQTVKSLF